MWINLNTEYRFDDLIFWIYQFQQWCNNFHPVFWHRKGHDAAQRRGSHPNGRHVKRCTPFRRRRGVPHLLKTCVFFAKPQVLWSSRWLGFKYCSILRILPKFWTFLSGMHTLCLYQNISCIKNTVYIITHCISVSLPLRYWLHLKVCVKIPPGWMAFDMDIVQVWHLWNPFAVK